MVQDITEVILNCDGNIEESRMTTLGSEFAMLMLVSGNWHTLNRLEKGLQKLGGDDLTFTIRKTGERQIKEDRMPYAVDVVSLHITSKLPMWRPAVMRRHIPGLQCSPYRWLSMFRHRFISPSYAKNFSN
jgi:hypothetical protein